MGPWRGAAGDLHVQNALLHRICRQQLIKQPGDFGQAVRQGNPKLGSAAGESDQMGILLKQASVVNPEDLVDAVAEIIAPVIRVYGCILVIRYSEVMEKFHGGTSSFLA
ncbi:hypothetical protein D3C76_1638400 [compost metagenome]